MRKYKKDHEAIDKNPQEIILRHNNSTVVTILADNTSHDAHTLRAIRLRVSCSGSEDHLRNAHTSFAI